MFLNLASCAKDDKEPDPVKTKTIEITVSDPSGFARPGISVYLFDKPATEANGLDPAKAIKNAITDEDGLAVFDMQKISGVEGGETIYFTALQKLFTNEYEVLGTVDLTIDNQEETVNQELITS